MRFSIFLFSLLIINHATQAQSSTDSISSGWGDLNYAVPEAPAFKILDVSSSNIMRPTNVKDIAVSIGQYYVSNGAAIPKNLAVEIAPTLFNPKVNLANFKKYRWLYTSSVSFGTKVNDNAGGYAVSAGLKMRIIDKADLRTNKDLLALLDPIGEQLASAFADNITELARNYIREGEDGNVPLMVQKINTAINDPNDPMHDRVMKDYAALESKNDRNLVDRINTIRDSIKKECWNKTVWDVGFASMFASSDSLIKNLNGPTKLGLWTTIGLPIGKKGQLLIGVNGQLKDSASKSLDVKNLNIGARFYYGQNTIKGYLEFETIMQSNSLPVYRSNLGLEANISEGLWLSLSAGIKKDGDKPASFVPGVNFHFANPQKKSTAKSITK